MRNALQSMFRRAEANEKVTMAMVWNAAAAANIYTGPLRRALERAYPEVEATRGGKNVVLEESDPAGYKYRAGIAAKNQARIVTEDLRRRSPDLNVLDYWLWCVINARMRKQEAAFPANRKETKDAYLLRWRKTAMELPTKVVKGGKRAQARPQHRRCEGRSVQGVSKGRGGRGVWTSAAQTRLCSASPLERA